MNNKKNLKKYLPEVNIPYEYDLDTYLYYTRDIDMESYLKLTKLVSEFVGSDCWAVSVNDEVLFDSYNDHLKSYTKRILEDVVRNQVIEDPHHSIFVHFIRCAKDADMRIYMFRDRPWTMNINYRANCKVFRLSFSKSS